MGKWQGRSRRKSSGGLYHSHRKKRKYEYGSNPIKTELGEEKRLKEKARGTTEKIKIKKANKINVSMPSKGGTKVVKIEEVLENPASADFTRRNIITKGTVVRTEAGRVEVTSRPGQEGTLNGVLIESE